MGTDEHVIAPKENEFGLSSTTLFVRNLPFTIDSNDLEKVFSDIGPVKRCFVVKDKSTCNPSKCRGFGYVTFALKDDAAKAKETVRSISGRKVFITFSNKKPRHKARSQPEVKINEETKNVDHIDTEITTAEMLSAEESLENVQKSKHKPKSGRRSPGNNDGRTVVLSGFHSNMNIKQLKKACKRIGEVEQFIQPVENYEKPTVHVLYVSHKFARIAVQKLSGKTLKGSVLSAVLRSKENKQVSLKSLKKSRLIIRNLPFKCSRESLMNEFSKFGEISELVQPTKTVGKSKKKLGFAFVQFKTVFDAAKALKAMNQKEFKGRPIAVDWTLPKKKYQLLKVGEDVKKDEDEEQSASDDSEGESRSVQSEDLDSEVEDVPDAENGTDGETDSEECGADENNSDGDNTGQRKRKKLRDAREGRTVFIRNLPFDASEEEICSLFEKFGKIAYCKIVVDDVTEHSRGCAFVKFEDKQSAEDCLDKCQVNNVDRNSEDDSQEAFLRNRPLSVTLAVPKGQVPKLLAENDSAKKSPRDKRNLYLAKEGAIRPGSEAAVGLSKSDLQKRQRAEVEKKAKLRMPHYIVSKTRLCFRNLPLHVDDKKLSDVLRTVCDGAPKKVKKAKIMRSSERFDSSGTGRSKGFGFVEFFTHEDALEVFRATNNNPAIFGPDRRPIVEFAIENSLILKRQEQRKAKNQRKSEELTGLKDNQQNKRLRKRKGVKRKRDKMDGSGGDTDGLRKNSNDSRKRQATNETISNFVPIKKSQDLNHRFTNGKAFNRKIHGNISNSETLNKNKAGSSRAKSASSLRTKHKQRENANKEEENFNKIVDKYKSKLFGDNTKQLKASRWF